MKRKKKNRYCHRSRLADNSGGSHRGAACPPGRPSPKTTTSGRPLWSGLNCRPARPSRPRPTQGKYSVPMKEKTMRGTHPVVVCCSSMWRCARGAGRRRFRCSHHRREQILTRRRYRQPPVKGRRTSSSAPFSGGAVSMRRPGRARLPSRRVRSGPPCPVWARPLLRRVRPGAPSQAKPSQAKPDQADAGSCPSYNCWARGGPPVTPNEGFDGAIRTALPTMTEGCVTPPLLFRVSSCFASVAVYRTI